MKGSLEIYGVGVTINTKLDPKKAQPDLLSNPPLVFFPLRIPFRVGRRQKKGTDRVLRKI